MFLGFSAYTWFHTIISLVAIVAGFVVAKDMLAGEQRPGWTALFLIMTVLTSVTGFGFPFDKLLPSHYVAIISLIVLAIAILALYVFKLSGPWRITYVITALIAFYFNVFVLVAQLFSKIPALHVLAPTQSEPAFAVAQTIVLVAFIALIIAAARKSRRVALAA